MQYTTQQKGALRKLLVYLFLVEVSSRINIKRNIVRLSGAFLVNLYKDSMFLGWLFSANPLAVNDDGQTALEMARSKGHTPVVRLLEVSL